MDDIIVGTKKFVHYLKKSNTKLDDIIIEMAEFGHHLFESKSNKKLYETFSTLKKVLDKLNSYRATVMGKVKAIDSNKEMVNEAVIKWLNQTDILIQEVEDPKINAPTSEELQIYLDELAKKIMALNKECGFDHLEPFSIPIPGIEHFSNGNIVYFKSTDETSNEILKTLKDDNCSIIGLYGEQGSGKTTLVKAMAEKVKFLNIFHEVLFVTVTQKPNIRNMQDEIGATLNMKFDKNDGEARRARRILSTIEKLMMYRPILVIFDDVRGKFDQEDVGIPCNSNLCKILLTTRRQQDCNLICCQREIHLGPLSTKEAWTLFKKYSFINDDKYLSSSNLLNVAQEVVLKCEGLPGMIKDVGSSLRLKPIKEWKSSLDSLQDSMTARWQIFLSFRGDDTRYSFTGSLYHALCQGGFKTFMDNGELQIGDRISHSLTKAIEASRLSIIVLSENYASSTWCLDELVKILECMNLKNQLLWPIFYKVEPSDIRHQKNSYSKAMVEHEKKFGKDSERVQKWRSALFEVSNLSGMTFQGYEHEFIQKIVERANHNKSRLQIRNINID